MIWSPVVEGSIFFCRSLWLDWLTGYRYGIPRLAPPWFLQNGVHLPILQRWSFLLSLSCHFHVLFSSCLQTPLRRLHWLHSKILLRRSHGSIMEVCLILLSYSPRDIFASIHTNLGYCFSTLSTVKIWYYTLKIVLLSKYVDNIRNTVSILPQYFSSSIVPCTQC